MNEHRIKIIDVSLKKMGDALKEQTSLNCFAPLCTVLYMLHAIAISVRVHEPIPESIWYPLHEKFIFFCSLSCVSDPFLTCSPHDLLQRTVWKFEPQALHYKILMEPANCCSVYLVVRLQIVHHVGTEEQLQTWLLPCPQPCIFCNY